jgi:hypothetical protein
VANQSFLTVSLPVRRALELEGENPPFAESLLSSSQKSLKRKSHKLCLFLRRSSKGILEKRKHARPVEEDSQELPEISLNGLL